MPKKKTKKKTTSQKQRKKGRSSYFSKKLLEEKPIHGIKQHFHKTVFHLLDKIASLLLKWNLQDTTEQSKIIPEISCFCISLKFQKNIYNRVFFWGSFLGNKSEKNSSTDVLLILLKSKIIFLENNADYQHCDTKKSHGHLLCIASFLHLVSLYYLSAKPTKWSNTLKQFVSKLPKNCLSVFDHFVELALKGLR